MGIFEELQEEMQTMNESSAHSGYYYSVSHVLLILVLGVLSNIQTVSDIHQWAVTKPTREFLEKQFCIEKVMCRSQFYNIMAVIKAEEFKHCFIRWMKKVLACVVPESEISGKTVAIDGKCVNSTSTLTEDGSILNIVSAHVAELKLTIGSHECMSKQGERAALRELIKMLELFGSVVVADALHCNKPTIEAIISAGADYLLVAKENTPALKRGIQDCLNAGPTVSATTKELNGGRIETRTAYTTTELSKLKDRKNWPNLTTVGAIHRQFENIKNGTESDEWHFYISSTVLSPEDLLHRARMEWSVESMHWLLDVHFQEDKTAFYDMNIQILLNTVRKIALNLARIYKDANCKPSTALNGILKANLFDFDAFADFIDFFRATGKLD